MSGATVGLRRSHPALYLLRFLTSFSDAVRNVHLRRVSHPPSRATIMALRVVGFGKGGWPPYRFSDLQVESSRVGPALVERRL